MPSDRERLVEEMVDAWYAADKSCEHGMSAALAIAEADIINLVIERAEQACRYVFKRQNFEADSGQYALGFEVACQVCERAIRRQVMSHLEKDIAAAIRAREHGR